MLHHAKSVDAKRNYALPVRFVGGRTESLPFPDDRFDAISIGLALRNLTDLGASFREMARVLKPGGRALLSVPLFDRGQGQGARARANQARAEAIHELLVQDARRQALPAKERARRLTALARAMRMETEADSPALEATAQAAWLAGEVNLTELLDVHRDARDDGLALLSLERAACSAREALRLITLEEAP